MKFHSGFIETSFHKRAFDFQLLRDSKNKRFIPSREIHQPWVITSHSPITKDSPTDNKTK